MTVCRVSLAFGAITLMALSSCLPHIGYEGVAPRALKDPGNGVISKAELRSIPNGQNLTIYMSKQHCGKRDHRYVQLDLSKPVEALITDVMCSESYRSHGSFSYTKAIHFALDDRDFDHLYGAIALVTCTGEKICKEPESSAQLAWYAESIDREAVRTALEALPIHNEIKLAFLRRADAASALIIKRIRELMPANRAALRDLQFEVRAKRALHWKEYDEYWKRFEPLHARVDAAAVAGTSELDLVDEVRTLRDDYVAACRANDQPLKQCLFGQLGRPLLIDVIRVAIAAKRPVLARTENAVLVEANVGGTAADDIAEAQLLALFSAKNRSAKVRQAKAAGADAATIQSTYGTDIGPDFSKSSIWMRPQGRKQNYLSVIEEIGATAKARARVIAVKMRSDRAEVTLQRWKPINVPAAEAVGLEPGDSVLAILKSETDRTGYIATVKRSNQLTGVRGLR